MTHFPRFISRLLVSATVVFFLFSCKKEKTPQLPDLNSCDEVSIQGRLTWDAPNKKYTYTTTGGGQIVIDLKTNFNIVVSHNAYAGLRIEFWGVMLNTAGVSVIAGNHENLNGKHLKDRTGTNRSLLFPDGTKLTMQSQRVDGQMTSISIIEGDQAFHINMACGVVNLSTVSGDLARLLDEAIADGETAIFEITTTGLKYDNIYQEDTPGNKVQNKVPLGELERASPNLVRDYYDDPRLGHT